MQKRAAFWSAILLGVLALGTPVLGALYLSRQQALEAEFEHVTAYARDVARRTDATADQAAAAFREIRARSPGPCSPGELAIMRRLDLTSSYIQAFGRMDGTRLACSSLGTDTPMDLGPVRPVGRHGSRIRLDVHLPIAPAVGFIVLERDGLAAIVHAELPVDSSIGNEDVALASFLEGPTRLATTRGRIDPRWLRRADPHRLVRFVDDGMVVAIVPSQHLGAGGIAAVGRSGLEQRTRRFMAALVPMALLGGGALLAGLVLLARAQSRLSTMLKSGLRHGELFLEYQPIVDLANGRWVGVEALCRWRRRDGELVRPEVFIPAAEEAGIIHLVTTRVLAQIAQDLPRIVALDPEFHVAVNLSADDLYASDTVPLLQATVSASGVAARHLQIEVTERGFMRTDAAREAVRAIRGIGIRVAVDDFGTGYSSLSYLELFELDLLKIDKSFVDTIGQGAATSQVVPHIIEMAKSLQLQMVAEGIESQAQADYLGQRGVRYGQGWLYARPMPLEALLQRLRQLRERAAMPPSPPAA